MNQRISSGKRWLFRLLLTGLLLLLIEGGARLYWATLASAEVRAWIAVPGEAPTSQRFEPHHYLCYALKPGYHRGATRHNRRGFRGPEIAVPKPAGTFRIAVLGGSTTYTEFVADDRETFTAVLQDALHAAGFAQAEVVNGGVPGYSSFESLLHLQFRVLDLQPDMVIVYHGVNDTHCRLVHPATFRADNGGRRQVWREPLDVRLLRHSVAVRLLARGLGLWNPPGIDCYVGAPTSDPGIDRPHDRIGGEPMAVIEKNGTEYFRRNLVSLCALSRAHGAQPVLATWAANEGIGDYIATPHYRRGTAEGNAVIQAVATEHNVPCFDFAAVMSRDRALWRDGRHVTAAGAKVKGQLFAKYLIDAGLIPRVLTAGD